MAEIKHPDEKQVREDRFMLAFCSRGDTAGCGRESMVADHEAGLAARKQARYIVAKHRERNTG